MIILEKDLKFISNFLETFVLVKFLIECQIGLELADQGLEAIGKFMDTFLILKETLDVALGNVAELVVGLEHH